MILLLLQHISLSATSSTAGTGVGELLSETPRMRLDSLAVHSGRDDLTGLGLIDAEMEMGSTWLGDID